MLSKPTPARSELLELIHRSVEEYKNLSPEKQRQLRRLQAISFVYGNLYWNENITREMVEKTVNEIYGE